MKSSIVRKVLTSVVLSGLGVFAVGCGGNSAAPALPPGAASMNYGCPANSVAILQSGAPAVINFSMGNVMRDSNTLVGGSIKTLGKLGKPVQVGSMILSPGAAGAVAGASSNTIQTIPTAPFNADGTLTFSSATAMSGMVMAPQVTNGTGQIVISASRIADFYNFMRGGQNFTNTFSPYSYSGGLNPYATTPGTPYIGTPQVVTNGAVFCATEVGFAISVTMAPGQYIYNGQQVPYLANAGYGGNAWVSGIFNGQTHGLVMSW